ncbi:lactonase family protein, partial [Opitutaceae bacterium]|nr:lactonase family protein [Opitutaceae bacterium]
MKAPVFVLLCIALVSSLSAKTVDAYFGTGTSPEAVGIFHAKFDPNTGEIGARTLAAKIKQPEFLAFHPNGSHLYAVAKSDGPVLAAYGINTDGSLTLLNTVPMSNGQGAHLAVHPSGKFLITAQYFSSSVGVFSLAPDGSIVEQTQVLAHEGPTNINPRQTHPRPHWTGFSPDGKFALVPDLGTDKIHFYRVNGDGPTLTPHSVA